MGGVQETALQRASIFLHALFPRLKKLSASKARGWDLLKALQVHLSACGLSKFEFGYERQMLSYTNMSFTPVNGCGACSHSYFLSL